MENDIEKSRQGQIESELCRLEKHFECLSQSISELSGRLSAVSVTAAPTDSCDEKETTLVPMAERLRKCNETLEASNNRIVNITQRIEI